MQGGCAKLLEQYEVAVIKEDRRCAGKILDVSFNGTLRPEQEPAAQALLAEDTGVLSATTAFGKTIIGAYLIGQRKVNTLILVQSSALLEQWKASLERFLNIHEVLPELPKKRGRKKQRSLIGQIGAGKDTHSGIIDIAIMQSLFEGEEKDVKPFVADYGMVIVDAKPNVRVATADRYQLMVEQYTIPRIGSIKLTKLTAHDLQKLYKELMENGRIDRKSGHGNPGLSSTTVRSLHLMLHSAFERAVKERLIPRNPTKDCIAPKIQKFEMQILQPEHIKEYLNAANARGLLPMFYLELVSGLRKGELTALLWSDLDIQNKTISVSKQYVKNPNGELTLSRPKTETSVRKVSIPQDAVDLLIAEHSKHPENPYMFPSPATGEMYYPDSVVNLHKKILKDAGLPHIRFHDLRHTFATLALQNGVDVKTVSSMLGHYDAGFTLRTYTHATRQKQDEAAQTMGSFMAQVM